MWLAFIAAVVLILCNFYCHIIVMRLRPKGSTVRKIPRGFLFEWISCPNYTCEIGYWLAFATMVQSVALVLFIIVGGGQMAVWAAGKHRNYRKEFKNYPKRWKMIPFLF